MRQFFSPSRYFRPIASPSLARRTCLPSGRVKAIPSNVPTPSNDPSSSSVYAISSRYCPGPAPLEISRYMPSTPLQRPIHASYPRVASATAFPVASATLLEAKSSASPALAITLPAPSATLPISAVVFSGVLHAASASAAARVGRIIRILLSLSLVISSQRHPLGLGDAACRAASPSPRIMPPSR